MAFSEALAERIRRGLARRKGIEEKQMVGGVGFLLNGNLLVGVRKDSLLVRLGPGQSAEALKGPHVSEFNIAGRPMKGWLLVAPPGVGGDDQLSAWVQRAVKFVGALPAKQKGQQPKDVTARAAILQPGEGRTVAVVGDVYRFLATGEDTGGRYALWEAVVPPGGGPPPHVHGREEEGLYVLEGEVTFQVGDERVVAKAGAFANMPVGTPHSFKNEGGRPARVLISVAPAGLERMFLEVGVPLAEGATTAPPPTEEEIEMLLAIAPGYGIEVMPPQS
jgi:quercetin dioxygenase-like cupin family protein